MSASGSIPHIPERPAGNNYYPNTNEWQSKSDKVVERVLNSRTKYQGQWQDQGVHDGTRLFVLPRTPDAPLSMLPLFKGTTVAKGLTPIEIFAAIRITSYRMLWDIRIQSANIIRSFSQHEFLFYLIWRGIGPIYNPRDVAGIQTVRCFDQQGNRQAHPDFTTKTIVIGYVSTGDVPGIPEQCDGCVRAQIFQAGYILEANANGGCDIEYHGSVDLAVSIPGWILSTLTSELPRCAARLRDAVTTFGVPPILIDKQQCIALQYISCNPDTRVIGLFATIIKPGTFSFYLDYVKMYTQGVVVTGITGSGASAVRMREELGTQEGLPRRMLAIDVLAEGVGGDVRITIDPRDKDGPDSGTGPGWW